MKKRKESEKMETLKIEKKKTLFIAHRGLSGIERENTASAFVAAGNRSYWGMETDVHRTADGRYILIHDDETGRVAGVNIPVEGSTFADLRALRLCDLEGNPRGDLMLPTPEEYFGICKRYRKKAVFELKNRFERAQIGEIVSAVRDCGMLPDTVFISFSYKNMTDLRALLPTQPAQYLCYGEIDENLVAKLKDQNLDIDTRHDRLNEASVALLHENGITVNCWTVNDPARGRELVDLGVDMITTNILEGV